jgi:Rrf2 family protein
MRFSSSVEYAIHGLVFLASRRGGDPVLVGEVAEAIKVPESYLRKVFQVLARGGLVRSQRGVRGGFVLGREPSAISLADIVEAIDGSLPLYECLKARRKCPGGEECPVSAAFDEARQAMAEVLGRTTLRGLAGGIARRSPAWLKVSECA